MHARARSALNEFERFFERRPSQPPPQAEHVAQHVLSLFRSAVATVPAYGAFLREQAFEPTCVTSLDAFATVPATNKDNYYRKHPLPALCRGGTLSDCDMLAMSSGSTGEPAVWPRFVSDELHTSARFEQVLVGAFAADAQPTLGVVCFALGTWVGGMYTTACCRHLAAKGYPITLVTPGNNKTEILRVLRSLAPLFGQVVLFGYPPFLKDVIDTARAGGFDWTQLRVRLVMAGEVFSETWRSLVADRLGMRDAASGTASLYGTADGGVLANETPLSVQIRSMLAEHPNAARALFGQARLPTLCQYDPLHRYFEVEADGSLLFSGDGGIPLLRYKILDRGGLVTFDAMQRFLADHQLVLPDIAHGPQLPFVFVFGRSSFALSYYGANIYPENVSVGVEQPEFSEDVTGKFVLAVTSDIDHNPELSIAVELAPGRHGSAQLAQRLASTIRTHLETLNSEFLHYAPKERRTPRVTLLPFGEPEHFPVGLKHKYTRE